MVPPAPARFSTTTCWPSCSESVFATMRAVVSVPPPGSKPTTVVIGFVGNVWAHALPQNSMPSAKMNLVIRVPPVLSAPLELGLPFLHERLAALGVVLAFEALAHPGPAQLDVVIAFRYFADGAFRRAQRQRRVGGDGLGVL